MHKHVFDEPLVSMHLKLTALVKALKEVVAEYHSILVKARSLDKQRQGDVRLSPLPLSPLPSRRSLLTCSLIPAPTPLRCSPHPHPALPPLLPQAKRAKIGLPVVKKTYMLSPGRVRTACLSPTERRTQEARRCAGLPATFDDEEEEQIPEAFNCYKQGSASSSGTSSHSSA